MSDGPTPIEKSTPSPEDLAQLEALRSTTRTWHALPEVSDPPPARDGSAAAAPPETLGAAA